MEEKPKLDMNSFNSYKESSLKHLRWQLKNFFQDYSNIAVDDVRKKLKELNAYENIGHLEALKDQRLASQQPST